MGKSRRRSPTKRVEARLTRTLTGQDKQLLTHLQQAIAEQERRRFWSRLGAPTGPLPT